MMHLMDAYKTNTNPVWLQHVTNLESQTVMQAITAPAQLRQCATSLVNVMKRGGQWKAPKKEKTEIVATPAEKDKDKKTATKKTKGGGKSSNNKEGADKLKAKHADWKFDPNQASGVELSKNDRTYHWCTGPGHFGIGMWVTHDIGTCTGFKSNNGNGDKKDKSDDKKMSKAEFKAHVSQVLQGGNTFGDDVSGLVDQICNKM